MQCPVLFGIHDLILYELHRVTIRVIQNIQKTVGAAVFGQFVELLGVLVVNKAIIAGLHIEEIGCNAN